MPSINVLQWAAVVLFSANIALLIWTRVVQIKVTRSQKLINARLSARYGSPMGTTLFPESKCPSCGGSASAATSMGHEHLPDPGDWTVCLSCSALGIFGDNLSIRLPEPGEFEALPRAISAQLTRVQHFAQQATGKTPGHA